MKYHSLERTTFVFYNKILMANYWNIEGLPHKGWIYETNIDLKEDGEDYEICMMCGRE